MKGPMTTTELFNKICSILEEKSKLPDILDYRLATSYPVPIKTCEFDLKTNLAYGDSEGIYLDFWIIYFEEDEKRRSGLGTFKTLDKSDGAVHIMAGLLADFIIEETVYVNKNLDDFTWEGADVRAFDDNGKCLNWCYSCSSMEAAAKKKDELLEKYPKIVIRDNATREETYFIRQVVKVTDERKEETEDVQAG